MTGAGEPRRKLAFAGAGESASDATLLALARRSLSFTGRIENMSEGERVFLLGAFTGAVLRLKDEVRRLYAAYDADDNAEALAALHQVMLLLGASEDWREER